MIFINMKSLKKFMFVLVNVLAFVLLVDCEDENYFEDTVNPENLVDPHSFYYDKQNKMMIKYKMMDTSREISEESTEIQSELVLEQSNYGSQEGVFYKRLINLLLTNIHIQDRDEMSITGLLEIKVSHSQMEMLQNFNFQKTSLRQIDEILSNIIKKPQYSYVHGVTTYIFNALQGVLLMLLEKIGDYPNEAMIAVAMLLIFLTIRMLKGGQRFSFVNFIQFICILSFFMTWWQLIQEAEIKYTAAQMKYTTIPISCQPDKMNMWDKFVSLFYSDDCEQYYKTMMTNPKLKVTPALALSHFITTVILHPITHVGTVVSDFINNATVELPWTYGWIVRCVLFLCVGLVIILIPFLLSGASFNFGLGPLLRFAISYPKSNEQGTSRDQCTTNNKRFENKAIQSSASYKRSWR
ncbi:chloride channel CLIC-like protein 1 isoform X2 [Xylocopa sonorina]|uniref:chloride channel CLIC-like protein 1 isoform X2 n=1 Tax=Xylocopa sonorina TaxID=1818115 RepID=UPI00403AEAE4